MDKILAIFLAAISFVPLGFFFTSIKGTDGSISPYEWVLITSSTFLISGLLSLYLPSEKKRIVFEFCNKIPSKILALLILLAILLTSFFAFENKPHLVDSIAQVFQTKIFSSFALTAPKPQIVSAFVTLHMLIDENSWYAQYPPGHSAVLALGNLLGLSWFLPKILAFLSALLIARTTKEIYGQTFYNRTLLLLLFCPFFIFMSASYMNHVSALFFLSFFFYYFVKWENTDKNFYLFLAGSGMGIAATVRPLTAIAVAIPFVFFAFKKVKAPFLKLIPGVISAVFFSSTFLLYNKLTTGNAFLPGYLKLWGSSHGLGFRESPWGEMHTPLTGLRNELVDLSLLNEYLFEWPIPSLFPIAIYFLFKNNLHKWDKRLLYCFLMLPITYFFYWHRDAFLGPRFMYEGIIFLVPLTVSSLTHGIEALKNKKAWRFDLADLSKITLAFCLLYAGCVSIPQRFYIYKSGFQSKKTDLLEKAKESNIEQGVIFVSVSWGNRIISNLRGHGVSASLAQKSYTYIDHCLLHQVTEDAINNSWSTSKTEKRLLELISRNDTLEKTSALNQDPTLKLRPGVKLTKSCLDEIRYDQKGYTIFTPSLLANQIDLSGPIVFARDLRKRNAELLKLYPGFPIYIYRGGEFVSLG